MKTPPAAPPVTLEEFSARCAALGAPARFAVAVSGGRDSMALLRLAAVHARRTGAELAAFTVDHGLRAEAAEEASQAGRWCADLNVPHRALLWRGDKPAAGVQAAAREARYRLLAEACEEAEIFTLMTAHSADDQAETVFMRLARGGGPRGLAAMEDETCIAAGAGPAIRLLRPLLSFSRARLTATVEAYAQPYVDDPGNDDPAYERIRTRALLAALEEQGLLSQKALLQTAGRMREGARRLKRREEEAFHRGGGRFYRWGGVSLDRAFAARLASDETGPLCARLIHAVSGEAHRPDETASSAALAAALDTGASTLGGAMIVAKKDRLWFLREPGAVLGRTGVAPLGGVVLKAEKPVLWDNRFIMSVAPSLSGAVIRPLGPAAAALTNGGLYHGPKEGGAAAPGLWADGELIAAPGFLSDRKGVLAWRSLVRERFFGGIVRFS